MKKKFLLLCIIPMILLNISAKGQTYDTLSHFGSNWRYLDDGSDQGATSWKSPTFADGTWSCGPSPIGYGDTWIVTCIRSGCTNDNICSPTCATKNITNYFRQTINVPSLTPYSEVAIDALMDDGGVVYVNGNQVWNNGMPTSWTYTTVSTANITGAAETTQVHTVIPMTYWVAGNNTIAVEMHQRAVNSSDVTLDMQFRFRRGGTTSINNLTNNTDDFNFYPNPSNGALTIDSKNNNLFGKSAQLIVIDVAGRTVAQQEITFAGQQTNIILDLNNGTYFGRLISDDINTTFRINIEK